MRFAIALVHDSKKFEIVVKTRFLLNNGLTILYVAEYVPLMDYVLTFYNSPTSLA